MRPFVTRRQAHGKPNTVAAGAGECHAIAARRGSVWHREPTLWHGLGEGMPMKGSPGRDNRGLGFRYCCCRNLRLVYKRRGWDRKLIRWRGVSALRETHENVGEDHPGLTKGPAAPPTSSSNSDRPSAAAITAVGPNTPPATGPGRSSSYRTRAAQVESPSPRLPLSMPMWPSSRRPAPFTRHMQPASAVVHRPDHCAGQK